MTHPLRTAVAASLPLLLLTTATRANNPPGEQPALGFNRITQNDITGGGLTLQDIRKAGMKMFATPFNKLDGYGDGPVNFNDTITPGGRPTLQNNGTFLRVNGLDAQTCQECHSVGSNLTVPFTFALGGVGGSNNNAIFQPRDIDVDDSDGNGFAFFNGRYINPPFLFGSGGIELLGKEMTEDLQRLKQRAINHPGQPVRLSTKGVHFGSIVYDAQNGLDTSNVQGVDHDLVVRPFGRKGEFATTRQFDQGAMEFHFGMQPVEIVGLGVDADGDGVTDELLIGEMSALHIFATNMERPVRDGVSPQILQGFQLFNSVGCARCHVPTLATDRRELTYSFPQDDENPFDNVYYESDLHDSPAGFDLTLNGGLVVPQFSDLKRHYMGPGLEETFGHELDGEFITARLWGVADTAPYLHDGRALTLTDAILAHGGEAEDARNDFDALGNLQKQRVLTFLRSLRTPTNPGQDIIQ